MKYFLFVYLVLNISLCIGQNFYSKELAFNTIDENGGSRFLNIKIDKNGIVKGVAGYECCQLGEADSWKGLILGKIKDNEINGSYKYQVEGENIDTVIKIRLFDDYAVFIEKESKEFKLNLEKTTIYTETYYKNRINVVNWNETSTMEGKLILKDLIDQESKLTLKNCLVLLLSKKIHILGEVDNKGWIVTEEIQIFDANKKMDNLDKKYSFLIGKNISISAKVIYAFSKRCPLLANIVGDFEYEIINANQGLKN